MSGIIVDIGAGDGKFVHKLAKENPDRFIIGIDPAHKPLEKISLQLDKKFEKGGVKNAFFVLANVEDLPHELDGLVNQVFINFPWGSLLKAIVLVDEKIWQNIKRICQPGGIIDLIFSYHPKDSDLPEIDLDYIKNNMLPKLEGFGFEKQELRQLEASELKDYPSSWAKKLAHGDLDRRYYYLRLISQ